MSSMKVLGKSLASRIATAVKEDKEMGRGQKPGDLVNSNLGLTFRRIGKEVEDNYDDEEKDELAEEIATELHWWQPKEIRELIKGGSNDALMVLSQQLANLFNAVKK